jgi:hypothetical protein
MISVEGMQIRLVKLRRDKFGRRGEQDYRSGVVSVNAKSFGRRKNAGNSARSPQSHRGRLIHFKRATRHLCSGIHPTEARNSPL